MSRSDSRHHGVDTISVGQYLPPSQVRAPVERDGHPHDFRMFAVEGRKMGFTSVASGPMVRSSYHADLQHKGIDVGDPENLARL